MKEELYLGGRKEEKELRMDGLGKGLDQQQICERA